QWKTRRSTLTMTPPCRVRFGRRRAKRMIMPWKEVSIMDVMILEKVPTALRGELTRWLIEPHPGVFVGHLSGMVRDKLWEKCCQKVKEGGALQLWSTKNEHRSALRTSGATRREVIDFEGLSLIRLP